MLTITRIVDNTHLLDATEIFRKLNIHKKVDTPCVLASLALRMQMLTDHL